LPWFLAGFGIGTFNVLQARLVRPSEVAFLADCREPGGQIDQKILNDKLQLFSFVGIPAVLVGGLVFHFFMGVKLFPNMPTLRELLARKSSAP
jgi:hypothetical protein